MHSLARRERKGDAAISAATATCSEKKSHREMRSCYYDSSFEMLLSLMISNMWLRGRSPGDALFKQPSQPRLSTDAGRRP
jgi:hypothetical protein